MPQKHKYEGGNNQVRCPPEVITTPSSGVQVLAETRQYLGLHYAGWGTCFGDFVKIWTVPHTCNYLNSYSFSSLITLAGGPSRKTCNHKPAAVNTFPRHVWRGSPAHTALQPYSSLRMLLRLKQDSPSCPGFTSHFNFQNTAVSGVSKHGLKSFVTLSSLAESTVMHFLKVQHRLSPKILFTQVQRCVNIRVLEEAILKMSVI